MSYNQIFVDLVIGESALLPVMSAYQGKIEQVTSKREEVRRGGTIVSFFKTTRNIFTILIIQHCLIAF